MLLRQRREIEMALRTVKLRRLLGATACSARPGCVGTTPAATDVGTAASATASLYSVPSLLTN
jgi:hypothetical protein